MYKIFIDKEAFFYLAIWAEEYKRFVLDCPPLVRKFDVYFQTESDDVQHHMIAQKVYYGYKIRLFENGKTLIKGKVVRTPDGENPFNLEYNIIDESLLPDDATPERVGKALSVYVQALIHSIAFLMYGNVFGDGKYIAAGRNEEENKIIVFRKCGETLYAVPTSAHKSPNGVFSVRGHFRKYKSGKVIWIDEYLKGTEKEKENNDK